MPSTRSQRQKQQTQLSFSPLADSSPAKATQPAATRSRAAAVTFTDSPRPNKRARTSQGSLPTPAPSSQTELSRRPSQAGVRSSLPSRHTRSFMHRGEKSKQRQTRRDDTKLPSSPTAPPSSYDKLLQGYDDSESDSEPAISPKRKSAHMRKRSGNSSRTKRNSKPSTARTGAISISSSDSSDEEGADTIHFEVRHETKGNQSGSGESGSESEEVRTPSRRRSFLPASLENGDSSEDREAPTTPSRGKRLSSEEQQEIEDDVADLRSSSPPAAMRPLQSSAKKDALDKLRKNREKRSQRSAGARHAPRVIIDDEDESFEESDAPIYADAEQQEEGYYDDAENEDWIEQDSGGEDGASALPPEMRLQSAKASELFPHVVEWMVHKRLNPGFNMNDSIYDLAFRKLNDLAHGMGSSKFQSSAWTGGFGRALKARPTVEETRFVNNGLEHDRCDACNRSGHPATFEVQFTGSPYSRETLEDVSDDEEDDIRDVELPPEETRFYIGKHCARNARTAHALRHWQRHLYDWVESWLADNDHLTTQAILKRDRMTTAKRTKAVNDIVDHMKAIGEIKSLHKAFKAEIETAQEQNQYTRFSSP